MSESTVSFSLLTDENGKIKVDFNGADKKHVSYESDSQRLSPCPSLASLVSTTVESEVLEAGKRRRVVSISTASLNTTDTFFDNEDIVQRTSTPLPHDHDDTDSISEVSFTSCVSRMSELSVAKSCSQETVTSAYMRDKEFQNDNISVSNENKHEDGIADGDWRTVKRNSESSNRADNFNVSNSFDTFRKVGELPPRNLISYEKKNKERYGGWEKVGDWRQDMKKPKEAKLATSSTYSTPMSSSFSQNSPYQGSANSSHSKSRIPSLMNPPVYYSPNSSRLLPSKRVSASTGSYASAASSKTHIPPLMTPKIAPIVHKVPPTIKKQPVKLTITTDSAGNMKINFSNECSQESWSVTGAIGRSEKIEVHKMLN
ncbi:hypothetical protein GCK72_002558 [Caenorhabditis remanei]|uniref:Uncharacterized protein n=1 Tax=Caenorhabditis remanei TaxID=31234 RepID=A0A6A5HT16_CAERE|nr:hypothetical protein GCK72_002558 [Caenorhabditis remanei]KAF1770735.1 hypothetical protein GCK72_002558 [Caenorhabditis remanei]